MSKVLNLRQSSKASSRSIKTSNSGAAALKVIKKAIPNNKPNPLPQLTWEAPSFYYNPQKKYLSLTIIALVIGGCSLLFTNGEILTAIFLLLSSLVLILYSTKRPEISRVIVDQRGIAISETTYYYKDLRSFWIHYSPGDRKELSLESKKWFMPFIKISIENKNPVVLRSFLINFLPEKEHDHSLVDLISGKLGI